MEVKAFTLTENHRDDLEALLFQLSGKVRRLNLENAPNCFYIGAFNENRLIGFVQFFILQKTTFIIAHLEDLIVHTDFRGQKIGEKLVKQAIVEATGAGVVVMTLTTRAERKSAWKLFESLNFKKESNQVFRLKLG